MYKVTKQEYIKYKYKPEYPVFYELIGGGKRDEVRQSVRQSI